uniref:Uncharacterized protein n=1 Tax=Arundo donax TaxID=35708 RepID=A0A0A8Z132_ARUDO
MKKSILNIQLGDSLRLSGGHCNHSTNCGHVISRSKCLIIISSLSLLKTSSNKTGFISLNRTI